MKKLLDYIMLIIFICSVCALDGDPWYIPLITMAISMTYLWVAYKAYEAKKNK